MAVAHWYKNLLTQKLQRISQVIFAASEGNLPAVIGLAEVENLLVLQELLSKTSLGKMGYKIIHQESPDKRGIDVALLYLPNLFEPYDYRAIPVVNQEDASFATRDILKVSGTLNSDTLHVFINHWPSKYGGLVETMPLRAMAAQNLKAATAQITDKNKYANLIILGDFNDSPFDESVADVLKALPIEKATKGDLVNLSTKPASKGIGSNKYQGKWAMIDQIIVSESMLHASNDLYTTPESFQVFNADFLLEQDQSYLGKKPFRTYIGFKYNNGFSDHLPVLLDLYSHRN